MFVYGFLSIGKGNASVVATAFYLSNSYQYYKVKRLFVWLNVLISGTTESLNKCEVLNCRCLSLKKSVEHFYKH